jgi:AraC-like DNA-binding protein
MDALSAVLRDMRLESAGYRYLELRAPWNIAFQQQNLRGVHIVVTGRCELVIDGEVDRLLEAGDLVVLPRADPHSLCSPGAKKASPIPPDEIAARTEKGMARLGGTGEQTTILCGAFVFHEADQTMLAALPHVIHVPAVNGSENTGEPSWLAAYVNTLKVEAMNATVGSDIVMARLSDALVARALRFHAENTPSEGWLSAAQDVHLARAIAAIHQSYERPWTLIALAKIAGLSRAAFAARFTEKVGEPPMQYLLRCRMRRAMTILTKERGTLARAAESVGYGSEAAFSAAFKRHTGVAPGAFKREGSPTADGKINRTTATQIS